MAGRAAEIAQPAPCQVHLLLADTVAVIERLDVVLEVEPTAFQQGNTETVAQQFHRERDSGGTGADNADICFDRRPVGQVAYVCDHLGT